MYSRSGSASGTGSVKIDINELGHDEQKSSRGAKIPDLMDIWNKTAERPYIVTIERPFTMLGTGTYEYSFVCKPEQQDPKLSHTFNCEIRIRKVLTDEGGTSATGPDDEVVTDFKAIYCDEMCYFLRCTMVKRKIWLRTRITIACEYLARESGSCWVLTGSVDDIQSLFTLNRTGEGLGPLAEYLSSSNTISFFTNRMEMKIRSSYGNWTFAQGKMEQCVGLSQSGSGGNKLPVAQVAKHHRRDARNSSERSLNDDDLEEYVASYASQPTAGTASAALDDFPSEINGNSISHIRQDRTASSTSTVTTPPPL